MEVAAAVADNALEADKAYDEDTNANVKLVAALAVVANEAEVAEAAEDATNADEADWA